jgi:L-gulonate 5-dehydrogenase
MKAVIFDAPGQVRIGDWDTPTLARTEVLVSPGAAGVCAGDMYIYHGKNPYATYPIIGGHEIAGTVAGVGPDVHGISVGSRVVVEPFIGCGNCYPCRNGKANCCANLRIIGVHRPGGYADFVTAPATHVHQIPDSLSLSWASFAEPLAIGIQACRRGEVVPGENVLILGCGPIGLALIEVVKSRGARPFATDVVESRLELASALGAETIPPGADLQGYVMDLTGGEGMPVVMEATGVVSVMESTANLVAAGGRIVIVGLVKKGLTISFPGLDITRKEMTILGSRASVNCFPEAIELLASGRITYPKVATEFDMWTAPAVFSKLSSDASIHKAVLVRA